MSPDTTDDQTSGPPTEPRPSRTKKILAAAGAIAVVLVIGLIVHARIASHRGPGNFGGGFRPGGPGAGGPLAVGVAQATTGDVPITIDSLGTVTPLATVAVHPMVTGPLIQIPFTEGQMVKAGGLLAQIDPRPFQATVDQAQGQLARDQAALDNAQVDLTRYKTLLAQNSVAEQTYATQQATVLQDEATLVSDRAALETANLNLSYTHILSPVNGSVGLRQVDLGNIVSAYTSNIVVVTQLQPMSVLFTVPEDDLTEVLQRLHGGDQLQAIAYDRTFTTKLDTGMLSNSDNEIDTATGTLKLRAMFNNSTLELFPDQFVNVRLTLDTLHNQVLVPGPAVQNGASGAFVYVVDSANTSDPAADPAGAGGNGRGSGPRAGRGSGSFGPGGGAGPLRTVHVRTVSIGPTVGNMISIRAGLQSGETVVVDGAEQLRDGASVTTPDQPATPNAAAPSGAAPSAPGASAAGSARPAAGGNATGGNGNPYNYGGQHAGGHSGTGGAHRRPSATPAPGSSAGASATPAAPQPQ